MPQGGGLCYIEVMRLFVAALIPDQAKLCLRELLSEYEEYDLKRVPEERWHMTFWFFRNQKAIAKVADKLPGSWPQSFAPAALITHVGRGRAEGQIWAYVQPTGIVRTLHEGLGLSLKDSRTTQEFVPHIKLASVKVKGSGLMVDKPVQCAFMIKELILFRSERSAAGPVYRPEKTIKLMV